MNEARWKSPRGGVFGRCSGCGRPSNVPGDTKPGEEPRCMMCMDSRSADNPGPTTRCEEAERQRLWDAGMNIAVMGVTPSGDVNIHGAIFVNVQPWPERPAVKDNAAASVPCYTCERNGRCHPDDGPCPDEAESVEFAGVTWPAPADPPLEDPGFIREAAWGSSPADTPARECYGSDASELADRLAAYAMQNIACTRAPCGHDIFHVVNGYCVACGWDRGGTVHIYLFPSRGPVGTK